MRRERVAPPTLSTVDLSKMSVCQIDDFPRIIPDYKRWYYLDLLQIVNHPIVPLLKFINIF